MMKRVASITYRFVLECNVGFLFVFLFFINKKELPPITLLFLTSVSGMVLFSLLLVKLREKGKWIYIATIFPVLLFIYHQVEHSLFLGLIIGLFIFWRGITLYEDVFLGSETVVLLLSFMVGLVAIIYSAVSRYPFQDVVVYLLISQLILVVLGSFYSKWYSIQTDKSKFALYFLRIFATFSILGIVLTLSLKYIQLAFLGILHVMVMLFSNLIAKPLLLAIEFFISLFGHKEHIPELLSSDMELEAGKYKDQSYGFTEEILYFLLFVGVVLFIAYLIYKRRLKLQAIESHSNPRVEVYETLFNTNLSRRLKRRGRPPEEFIRKEIYNLEKYAHKIQLGRLSSESLEEWWKRIGLVGGDEIMTTYEKVRYGEIQSSVKDQTFFKTEIQQLKQQMKDIHNKLKH